MWLSDDAYAELGRTVEGSVAAPVCVVVGDSSKVAMLMPRDETLAFLREQDMDFLSVDAAGAVFRRG